MSRSIERIGYLTGTALLSSGLLHLGILIASGGSWEGPLSWRKPATFGLSFGLTLFTIVWVTSFISLRERTRSILLGAFATACVLETTLVSIQTWRGVPSHFNVETVFDEWVTRGLAAGGLALVSMVVTMTVIAFRVRIAPPPGMAVAIRSGFVILCGAMAVGAIMIARGMTLVFGGNPEMAYATGGLLKPIHAVTMHAILVLPGLAWLLAGVGLSADRQRRYVITASAAYVLAIVIIGWWNASTVAW